MAFLFLTFLFLALPEGYKADDSCFKVVGRVNCGSTEYVPVKVELYNEDDIEDDLMFKEFGCGRFPEGPTRQLIQNQPMIVWGCAYDFSSDADPLLRLSEYSCNGKTSPVKIALDRNQCDYQLSVVHYDDRDATTTVKTYRCLGIKVFLNNGTLTQRNAN